MKYNFNMYNPVSFIQVNQKKAFAATVELNNLVKKKQEYVCLITEPYTYKGKVCATPPGGCVLTAGVDSRAGIIASKPLNLIKIDHLTNKDCTVALLKLNGKRILIASVYLDIKKEVVPSWLEEVTKYAESKKYSLIIGADTNAHSTLYGLETNSRGEELESFIINNAFSIENLSLIHI